MIRPVEILQWRTYLGRLAGIPHRETNNHLLVEATKIAADKLAAETPVALIQPRRRKIKGPRVGNNQPPRQYERLPGTTCCAVFESPKPAKSEAGDGSSLIVVWLQDDWAMPIAAGVLKLIRGIDWDAQAKDWHF
ncbi:MAG: hypothetical protein WCT12_33055 [Verrucomicrobiota bacterium]